MRPSRAEVARTLARGRLPGRLRLDGLPAPAPVTHATDRTGRPLLLVRDGDDLDTALPASPGVTLSVEDVPPVDGAPSLGQLRIEGRPRRLASAEASAAVQEFADGNPVADLLDVGHGASLWLVNVDRVRLDQPLATVDIEPAWYAAAAPDPLHELERDLLADLADHHAPQIESYLRCLLALTGRPCRSAPRAVRLDRYGFIVDTSEPAADHWVRLSFPRPVHCRHDLAHLLHPVLFPTCPDPPAG
jgi:uncharacterized protein DUF2470